MAKETVIVWFRRTDGQTFSVAEGSAACEHMRREQFEEIPDPTTPEPDGPTDVTSVAAPKGSRKGTAPKGSRKGTAPKGS